jgi:hypothetical protein
MAAPSGPGVIGRPRQHGLRGISRTTRTRRQQRRSLGLLGQRHDRRLGRQQRSPGGRHLAHHHSGAAASAASATASGSRIRWRCSWRALDQVQGIARRLCERIPRPADILLRPIKEGSENRQKRYTPTVDDGAMHRITRDEHEITGFDAPRLAAYSEPALALQNQHEFVMVRLDVDDILTFFENVTLHERCSPSHRNVRLMGSAAVAGRSRDHEQHPQLERNTARP